MRVRASRPRSAAAGTAGRPASRGRATASAVLAAAVLAVAPPAGAQTVGPPTAVETTQPGGDATRRNWVAASGLRGPLREAWRVDFAQRVGHPVVGDGRVFVPLPDAVVALDLATGRQLWVSPGAASYLGYSRGRVVATGDGLRAIDAATGARAWTVRSTDGFGGVLVTDDLVVTQGQGLRAYDLGTGALRWSGGTSDGTGGEPAAAGGRIFQYGGCTVAAVDRASGGRVWQQNTGCGGGGGGRVLLDGDRVLAGSSFPPFRLLDGTAQPGTAEVRVAAAGTGLRTVDKGLQAFDVGTGAVRWTSTEPDLFEDWDDPLVIGDTVVRAHVGGDLRLLRLADGRETWRGRLAPSRDVHTGSQDQDADLAAGPGRLVVGRGATVQALTSAAAGSAGRVTLTRRYRGYVSEAGTRESFAGRVSGPIVSPLRLAVDDHPLGGGFRPTGPSILPDAKGRFTLRTTLRRNARVRVVEAAGARRASPTIAMYVAPRIRFTVRNVDNRITTRIRVSGSPAVRFRGRRVALYLARVRSRTLVRIRTARLGGPARRTGRATVRFPALRSAGRRDYLVACVIGAPAIGQGPAAGYLGRCGRGRIRY